MKFYTHGGRFHCDEVTAFSIMLESGHCHQADLIRLEDLSAIPMHPADIDAIVVDIGRKYEPSAGFFDHHQDFIRRENGYPIASAGLIWRHYGKDVLRIIDDVSGSMLPVMDAIHADVDERLIQGLDAHDADSNYYVEAFCIGGPVDALTLPMVVSSYNDECNHLQGSAQERFLAAANLVRGLLLSAIDAAAGRIRAVTVLESADRPRPGVMVIQELVQWKEFVCEHRPEVDFLIAPSNHPGNPWSMFAVPVEPKSRTVKRPIERPDWFEGFIHNGKWIAGADSVETLVKLASDQSGGHP